MMSIFNSISQKYEYWAVDKEPPVLITKAALRSTLAAALRVNRIPLFVASFDEIGPDSSITVVGTI